ncbi:tetratricopeptide repeat protein [Sporosarcina jiandibaonis]|uniref:tetratricopeptide repeat protein n=1 Tax=Sporosarcina jiandibaonis TaxID=2715535 RepID=UPI0015563C12|nr:tetratricopeptide repeat protein [Sporosarcina jiandibaonis]
MRKKYRRLRKSENVIVFPGTFEKLVAKGIECVKHNQFEKAVEAFDQAIIFEPEHPEFLGPYAVALYETKDFERARDIATRLLHSGTANYVDAMELYLTICIQLQEYEEVEMTIDTLLEEGIIPKELLTKFTYLRELNSRLSMRYTPDESIPSEAVFTFEEFLEMDIYTQQHTLASLEGTDLRAMIPVLEDIAESVHLPPLIVTFAITLLQQVGYAKQITIKKFGDEMVIVPAQMTLPGQDTFTQNVLSRLEEILVKDPSRFEMAKSLIEKFAITAFPFTWGQYEEEEVAYAYVDYIECLFTGEELPNTSLHYFIKQIDDMSNFE